MEEHALVASLEQSRARLRVLLLPDPVTGKVEADVFPRSAITRALLGMLGALFTLLLRRRRRGAGTLLPGLVHGLLESFGTQR